MTNLPEAGGVAWTNLYTEDGTQINVTARAETPGMAISNLLAAIEESGLLTCRPKPERSQPEPDKPAHPQTQSPNNLGLLDRKPKASELNPGDRYEIQVDEYEASPVAIRFYRKGLQFPEFTHSFGNEVAVNIFNKLFNNWQPEEDEERHDIPGGSIILAVQCSNKLTSKNNPYQNLDGMRRP